MLEATHQAALWSSFLLLCILCTCIFAAPLVGLQEMPKLCSLPLYEAYVVCASAYVQLSVPALCCSQFLTSLCSPEHTHDLGAFLPTWKHIKIPVVCVAFILTLSPYISIPPSLFYSCTSFGFRSRHYSGNHFRQANQNNLHPAYEKKGGVLPSPGSFKFMRPRPDRCPHWLCQGCKHASVIRANSYWKALH